jgi:hypothetical protein
MTERNNEDRLGNPSPPPPQPEPTQQMPIEPQLPPTVSPMGQMNFSIPTEFVELPSRGKYYPDGHPLHNKQTVEIKYMTAKEEDILASSSLIKRGVVFDRLLQSIMVDRVHPDDMLIGDKNAVLIAARMTGYGPDYETQVTCPSCKQKSDFNFDLTDSRMVQESKASHNDFYGTTSYSETERGTFLIELTKINAQIEVKAMNGHDEKKLSSVIKSKSKNNLQDALITDSLKCYVISVNGNNDRAFINKYIDTMPAMESRKLRTVYKNIIPKINVMSHFSCANCAYEQELEVPININFFWPNE